jgi:nicotinate-nucleotide adenylyltransferase
MGRITDKNRIGYFGGTFDPPHLGHLILAREAAFQLELNEVRWILTPDPPHKPDQQITSVDLRMEMLELITDPYPDFKISTIDIDRAAPHFAADTVELIKEEEPIGELIYIIGEDSLRDLPDWRDPERFLANIDYLAIAPRPGVLTDLLELELLVPSLREKVKYLEDVQIEISSSKIRSRVKSNKPYGHFLTKEVSDFIAKKNIYRST